MNRARQRYWAEKILKILKIKKQKMLKNVKIYIVFKRLSQAMIVAATAYTSKPEWD